MSRATTSPNQGNQEMFVLGDRAKSLETNWETLKQKRTSVIAPAYYSLVRRKRRPPWSWAGPALLLLFLFYNDYNLLSRSIIFVNNYTHFHHEGVLELQLLLKFTVGLFWGKIGEQPIDLRTALHRSRHWRAMG